MPGDTARKAEDAALLAAQGLRLLGVRRPLIGLCGLNPHAGDNGLMGDEEKRILAPLVRRLRKRGVPVRGPLPPDGAWGAHRAGAYDALVALYHDQAMAPLKAACGSGVVNWTVGLPVVRTSPGHGIAFDIAGRGLADPSGMIEAVLLAARLAGRRTS